MTKSKKNFFTHYKDIEISELKFSKVEFWEAIEDTFENICISIEGLEFVSKAEAVKDNKKKNLIGYAKYNDTLNHHWLTNNYYDSQKLIAIIRNKIEQRKYDYDFTIKWAELNQCYGYLMCLLHSEGDGLKSNKASAKGNSKKTLNKEKANAYIAELLTLAMKKGFERHKAETKVEKFLLHFKEENKRRKNFDKEFFKELINEKKQLKPKFSKKNFKSDNIQKYLNRIDIETPKVTDFNKFIEDNPS